MPDCIRADTIVTTTMIEEKFADHVPSEGWRRQTSGTARAQRLSKTSALFRFIEAHYAEPDQLPWRMKSAMRSPIIIVVQLVLARTQLGITEASATRRPLRP